MQTPTPPRTLPPGLGVLLLCAATGLLAPACGPLVPEEGDEARAADEPASGEEAAPDEPPAMVEKLINGQFSDLRPEVGYMLLNGGMCTATLIRPNVAITAAHCVEYLDADAAGRTLGTLTLEPPGAAAVAFPIDGYRSYSGQNDPGVRDVALLRLAQPVPSAVARPTTIAERAPEAGEEILWMGYGCGQRGFSDDQSGRKQKLVFAFQGTDNSCPGDYGGPSFLGLEGPVFRVTSGYYTNGGGDIFGDAVAMRSTLEGKADAWAAPYLGADDGADDGAAPDDGAGDGAAPDDGAGADDLADDAPPDNAAPAPPPVPAIEYPDIVQTYLRGNWVALEWTPVRDAGRYAVLLMGRAPDGQWGYTARFDAGKDTGRQSKYVWLGTRELCARMPAATRGKALRLSVEVRPNDEKARARRAPVPQPLTCPR